VRWFETQFTGLTCRCLFRSTSSSSGFCSQNIDNKLKNVTPFEAEGLQRLFKEIKELKQKGCRTDKILRQPGSLRLSCAQTHGFASPPHGRFAFIGRLLETPVKETLPVM
jgi:hypothetical protein